MAKNYTWLEWDSMNYEDCVNGVGLVWLGQVSGHDEALKALPERLGIHRLVEVEGVVTRL